MTAGLLAEGSSVGIVFNRPVFNSTQSTSLLSVGATFFSTGLPICVTVLFR